MAAEAHYRAQPATQAAEARLITDGLVWKCGTAGCSAGKSSSRPLLDCQKLARKVGALESFSAAGKPLAPAELQKCNARAR